MPKHIRWNKMHKILLDKKKAESLRTNFVCDNDKITIKSNKSCINRIK